MIKPNLFIVGAAKSGTSSLWQYLRCNPEVFMPEDELYKEPCFFSDFGKGMGLPNYLNIFKKAADNQKYVGEASTAYLSDPTSAQRLFAFNPDAKIIIILRNPADRAYSLYNWMVQDGYEFAATFKEALKLEKDRERKTIPNWYEPQYYWNYMYFRSGLYAEQVERFLNSFDNKVFIVKFDNFKSTPNVEYDKICDFLGVKRNKIPTAVFNPSRQAKAPRVQFVLRKITGRLISSGELKRGQALNKYVEDLYHECIAKLAKISRFTIRDRLFGYAVIRKVLKSLQDGVSFGEIQTKEQRDRLMGFGLVEGRPSKIDERVRQNLLDKYKIDIKKLCVLTGINFNEWTG